MWRSRLAASPSPAIGAEKDRGDVETPLLSLSAIALGWAEPIHRPSLPPLLRVNSRPAWRSPVRAARTVCGSQPSSRPSSSIRAPCGRSSSATSTARLVFARGRRGGVLSPAFDGFGSPLPLDDAPVLFLLSAVRAADRRRAPEPIAAVLLVAATGRAPRRADSGAGLVRSVARRRWRLGLSAAVVWFALRVELVSWPLAYPPMGHRPLRCLHHRRPGIGSQAGRRPGGGRRQTQQSSARHRSRVQSERVSEFWVGLRPGPAIADEGSNRGPATTFTEQPSRGPNDPTGREMYRYALVAIDQTSDGAAATRNRWRRRVGARACRKSPGRGQLRAAAGH
jgi:hypothetical protein